jgi:hypothetical protein
LRCGALVKSAPHFCQCSKISTTRRISPDSPRRDACFYACRQTWTLLGIFFRSSETGFAFSQPKVPLLRQSSLRPFAERHVSAFPLAHIITKRAALCDLGYRGRAPLRLYARGAAVGAIWRFFRHTVRNQASGSTDNSLGLDTSLRSYSASAGSGLFSTLPQLLYAPHCSHLYGYVPIGSPDPAT